MDDCLQFNMDLKLFWHPCYVLRLEYTFQTKKTICLKNCHVNEDEKCFQFDDLIQWLFSYIFVGSETATFLSCSSIKIFKKVWSFLKSVKLVLRSLKMVLKIKIQKNGGHGRYIWGTYLLGTNSDKFISSDWKNCSFGKTGSTTPNQNVLNFQVMLVKCKEDYYLFL